MAITFNIPEEQFEQILNHSPHLTGLDNYGDKNKIWLQCNECHEIVIEFVRGEEEVEDGSPNNSDL